MTTTTAPSSLGNRKLEIALVIAGISGFISLSYEIVWYRVLSVMTRGLASTFGIRHPEAYERLLMDVVRGNPMLFMRRDEVEQAWRWIDPILAAWESHGEAPRPYAAGSWGPSAAVALIERDGRTWHDDDT